MDWYNVFRVLLHGKPRLRTNEVLDMTFTDLDIALNAPEEGKPLTPWGAPAFISQLESQTWYEWFRSLTPRQRLSLARDGRVTP